MPIGPDNQCADVALVTDPSSRMPQDGDPDAHGGRKRLPEAFCWADAPQECHSTALGGHTDARLACRVWPVLSFPGW